MYYRTAGLVPPLRHTVHTSENGAPVFEEMIGEEGFSGTASYLYHLGIPSNLVDAREWKIGDLTLTPNTPLLPRHFRLPDLFDAGHRGIDVVRHRRLVLGNADVRISYVIADAESPLYSNGIGDEVVYIEKGEADLESVFGTLRVRAGDNVIVPRATIHRWVPVDVETNGPLRAYCVEGAGHIQIPRRYLSELGQFLPGAPLNERDLRGPVGPLLASDDEAGKDTEVYVKHGNGADVHGSVVVYDHHPFDVVGWDGYLYPYAFNYRDFSPVTGRVLQPPTTYQILQGQNFVVCNFVPRPLEYGEGALTVPYYHSNVDADEVMFYHAGETAARKGTGIANASVSLHPAAYTHGPTRGAYLSSVGASASSEMAFMVDTTNTLLVGEGGTTSDDDRYPWSWSGRHGATSQ